MAAQNNKVSTGQMIFSVIWILLLPALLLILAGDWFWIQGWLFDIWYIVLGFSTVIYLYFKDPGLLLERLRKPGTGGEKGWDKYWLFIFLILFMAWFVIMPLDAKRYLWTINFPLWLEVIGGILLLIGFYFTFRALADNPYASAEVRIQTERKQKVVSTGVYGFVRHPMYLGGILYLIGAPLLLGSKYGLLLGILMAVFIVVRIVGEEKALIGELEGYKEYMERVKHRLIPFIW
ncbi:MULTISPECIES: methyltransferase family protein [Methanobacterium]|uniref:Isoprenylcysteine carboxyl methyltransferase n=1 Tax=Methanobacterium bryantii TaxID=2161 RepID=A0A2A2H2X2_METBR|nr:MULTISPECIES: isoprenylcysteine carboxylmethyltransferase family protein [Methanobacterium]OEC87647.1 isoprenylcysteine carboxyl methyltransferase [Methanobacterium sp. A39]PAV03717.1 isoprenylcysteine carboxyl methyltransferase [Methanobacterium bryantii]